MKSRIQRIEKCGMFPASLARLLALIWLAPLASLHGAESRTNVDVNVATAASAIQVREGFRVEHLSSRHSGIAMCFDAQGNIYTARDLFDNIVNPSKVINEQYALTTYTKKDGSQITGRLVNMSGDDLIVATNPIDPGGSEIHFSPRLLASTTASTVSLMPEELLNTLTEADLLDLLAYLMHPASDGAKAGRP